jgi:hypothetical protein
LATVIQAFGQTISDLHDLLMNSLPSELHDADLAKLLQTADAECALDRQPLDGGALVDAARRRRSRSRRMRVASSALGAALIAAVVSLSGPKIAQPIAPSAASDEMAAELRQVLDALDREAKQRRGIVLALRQSEQLAARQTELNSLASESSKTLAEGESSRSAAISLQYAMLVEQEAHDAEQARREYERVAQRFRGTQWADVAAASLDRLPSTNSSAL